ncbi:peptidyl-prolyl cis-trans isomerase C [Hathewaya proteolytica DSM 3090]|uniref:Peptidyl-prolyl cis-trans isomerase C n=1 Tax=Hathewaya proteolytica DSM 3090 TaxID=1121331 RepID=A0A1M6MFN1_9CLOT|nr:peptidylprolyl isomerase [Hathewaya proteolytica]SHJ82274.1 peptidyl-prolyl cis-trans isomerase C [Hathewaya proteolytica DSM 3090]
MSDKVLAVVNGTNITEADLNFMMETLNPQVARQFNSKEGKSKLLQELINQELFYCNAMDEKVYEEEEFKAELEKIKRTALKQYALRKMLASVSVTMEEAQKFYEEHKEAYKVSESVRASHILIAEEDEALGKEIIERINKGEAFEDLAKEYSNCPSSEKGGDLGQFTRGQMVPEFDQAVFAMKVGDVSGLVKTQFGHHIIKVTDKKEAGIMSFEEVKNQVINTVLSMKQQETYLSKSQALADKYQVEIVND